jgi:hypothetical protein
MEKVLRLMAAWIVFLTMTSSMWAGEVLLQEDFESFSTGDFPSPNWHLGGGWADYEAYSGNHVVSGISGNPTNSMMVTNPYNGWGMHIQREFSWNPGAYDKLLFEISYLYPAENSHNRGNSVDFRLCSTALNTGLTCHLGIHPNVGNGVKLDIWGDTLMPVTAGVFDFGQWITVIGEIDANTGTYSMWANGLNIASDVPLYGGVTAADIEVFYCGKGFWNSGPGYYDGILVQGVPEPATLIFLSIGGVLLKKRR